MISTNNSSSNNRRIRRRRWEKAYHSQSYHSNMNATTTNVNANANDDLRLPDGIIIGIGTISSISININSNNSNTSVINSIVNHSANLKHSSLWSYLRHNLNNHLNNNDNDNDEDDDDNDDGGNDDNNNDDNDDNNDSVISVISGLESMNNDANDVNDTNDTNDTSELLGLLDDIDANVTIHSEGMNAALSAYYILKGITRGTTVGYVGTILHGNDENSIDINDEKMVIENYINGTTMIPDAYNDNDTNTNGAIDIQLASRRSDNSDNCTSRIINVINTNANYNASASASSNANANTNIDANTNANTIANNDMTSVDIDHNSNNNDDDDAIESNTINIKGSIFSSDFKSPEINASLICASYWMLSTKEFLRSYGGYESLVTICNMSTKLSKCLVINLSADISFTKNKESLSMIIPHTDFLFITVKGIKKYANYLYENVLLSIEETAVRISLQAKASGRRPRIVIVCGYQHNDEHGVLICLKAQYYFLSFSLANTFSETPFRIDNEEEVSVFMGAFMGRLIHVESQIVTIKETVVKGKNDPQTYLLSTPKEHPLYRPNKRAAAFSSSSSLLMATKSVDRFDGSISRSSIDTRYGKLQSRQSRLNTGTSRRRGGNTPWDSSTIISPSISRLESRQGSPKGIGGNSTLFDRSWISDFEESDVLKKEMKRNSNLGATTDQRMLDEYPIRKGDRSRRAFTPSIAFLDSLNYRNDVLKYQPNESNYYTTTNNNTNSNIEVMFSNNGNQNTRSLLASKGTIRFAPDSIGLDWPQINAICVGKNGITECCIAGFQSWAYAKASCSANLQMNTTQISIPSKASITMSSYINGNDDSYDNNTTRTNNTKDTIHS